MVVLLLIGFVFVGYFSIQPPALLNNNDALMSDAKNTNKAVFSNVNTQISVATPKSLKGVVHGVVLRVDSDGNLIIEYRIRDLFEFYLSAMGEEPLEVILKRIHSEFYEQLPESAITGAKLLLKDYVDYRIDLAGVNKNLESLDINSLSQTELLKLQKNEISLLRSQYFNDESYQAFFEKEEILDQYMLSQLEIAHNPDLTPQQKQQQIDTLQTTLPEQEQYLRKKVSQHADIGTQVKEMRSTGSTDEAIFQLRAQSFGVEAAQNLADLDDKRDEWKNRLENYTLKRNDILASGLSDTDARAAISELIEHDFNAREGLRVKALDSIL